LELYTGPVLSSSRSTALAGADVANPSASNDAFGNPAAPAVRDSYSVNWFDYQLSGGIAFPGSVGRSDIQNRPAGVGVSSVDRTRQFLSLEGGATAQFGHLGISADVRLFRFDVGLPEGELRRPGVGVTFIRYQLLAAYGFMDGQLVIGGGLRALTLGAQQFGGGLPTRNVLTLFGAAPEVGVVYKPYGSQFNLGAAYRAAIRAGPIDQSADMQNGVRTVGSFIAPGGAVAPWELEIGGALQLGPRPLNPRWINPRDDEAPLLLRIARAREARTRGGVPKAQDDAIRRIEDEEVSSRREALADSRRKRDANWPREKLLILASVLVTGRTDDAVSVIGFTDQQRDLVGQRINLSPRLGLEAEPVVDRLKMRLGTYFEPSRYVDGNYRAHYTFGTEVKLFSFRKWWIFPDTDVCLQGAVDVAPRYVNIGGFFCIWR
jgi:hypothetical protein